MARRKPAESETKLESKCPQDLYIYFDTIDDEDFTEYTNFSAYTTIDELNEEYSLSDGDTVAIYKLHKVMKVDKPKISLIEQ